MNMFLDYFIGISGRWSDEMTVHFKSTSIVFSFPQKIGILGNREGCGEELTMELGRHQSPRWATSHVITDPQSCFVYTTLIDTIYIYIYT